MKQLAAVFVILLHTALPAQTPVSGNVSGIWNVAGSPYYVVGNATVVNSLTIEAGVLVQFQAGGHSITVGPNAQFLAQGTAAEPIVFEPLLGTNPGSWEELLFTSSAGDDTLSHVTFRHAVNAVEITGNGCTPYFDNCTMEGCSSSGINVIDRGHPVFHQCVSRNNALHGAKVYSSYDIQTTYATFYKCRMHDNGGDGINIRTDNAGIATMSVINCTIAHNLGSGVSNTANPIGDATTTLTNSILAYNADYGLYNNIGVMNADFVAHNLFWGNGTSGILGIAATDFGSNTSTNVNGDSCDVNLNLFLDPVFCDPDTLLRDYTLSTSMLTSPAIDAGTPIILGTVVMDPDLTMPDLGSEWPALPCTVGMLESASNVMALTTCPNPASNWIEIRVEQAGFIESGPHRLDVFDSMGARAMSTTLQGNYDRIDISDLAPGVYHLTIPRNSGPGAMHASLIKVD